MRIAIHHHIHIPVKETWKGLRRNTDLVSTIGIFAITTCFLAAKIFKNTPKILPRVGKVIYDFGGIIWLEVQIKEFFKSCLDLKRVIKEHRWNVLVPVAAKVFLAATGIIFTVSIFSGSVIAACGYPQLMLAMTLTMRPISLTAYFIQIASDTNDFFVNKRYIRNFHVCSQEEGERITSCFYQILHVPNAPMDRLSKEYGTAQAIIRQLDADTMKTLFTMERAQITNDRLRRSVVNKNTSVAMHLVLTALGYITRGLSKAYPETIVDMTGRWVISLLYTGTLVNHKLFLYRQKREQQLNLAPA